MWKKQQYLLDNQNMFFLELSKDVIEKPEQI